MNNKDQNRKLTLDHHIDEKFGEIFFMAKEEYDIQADSKEEQRLYDLLEKYRMKLKENCEHHFVSDDYELEQGSKNNAI